jgi:hypothetical protein
VDWAALSPRSQAALRVCWQPMLLGWTHTETANALGVTSYDLADALAQLRDELRDNG